MDRQDLFRIVVLPSFYPMEHNYTRGNFFEEQTKLIIEEGGNLAVVFNEDRSLASMTLAKLQKVYFQKVFSVEDGVPVFRRLSWNIIPTRYSLGRRLWTVNAIRLVESFIQRFGKPDLFHVHCVFNAGLVARYFFEKYQIPYIVTEHSSYFALSNLSEDMRKQAYEVYRDASEVVVVSNPFRGLLSRKVDFSLNRISVIPNFIDTNYFNPELFCESAYGAEKIIFTVCHHGKNKRLDRLIDSFHRVLKQYPEWRLVIGGSGTETSALKRQVERLGLSNEVSFSGFLTKELVRQFLGKVKIFALSSDVETFGVVLIEAMAMGVPVISTKSGGPEDIVTEETGVLTERNVDAFTEGLIDIISNYDNYDKVKIRSHVLKNFSGKAIAGKYLQLYDACVFST